MESSDMMVFTALMTAHVISLLIFCAVNLIIDRLARYDGKPWQRRLAHVYYLKYLNRAWLFVASYIALFVAIFMAVINIPPFSETIDINT